MDWLFNNICFLTISGSQSYGINTEFSDLDMKGICVPPKKIREHLFQSFNQAENNPEIEKNFEHLKNPKNPKFESTIYSLAKFLKLAGEVNPNIVELLWVDSSDIQKINKVGEVLLENRNLFISSKAKFTFGGYSWAQFHRIERHRKWLVKGEIKKPERKDYGLKGESLKGYGEIERIIKRDIENWNLSKFNLDELQRQELKETIWDCVLRLCQNKIDWGNWPAKYEEAALTKFLEDFNISKDITDLIIRETKYKNDFNEYSNWLRWKEKRNLERKKLEQDFMYDTKHAGHLYRLQQMCMEILEGKGVITKRPDREKILEIRNGKWTFEQLVEEFNKSNEKIEELYKTTKLPRSVNFEKINELYYNLLEIHDKSV